MAGRLSILGGLGLGALLMYFLDPDRGKRRRALLRDQGAHLARVTGDTLNAGAKDLMNRLDGAVSETASLLTQEGPNDEILAERVRAKLGRLVSHPHAIEVMVHEGQVDLRGIVLAHELGTLLQGIRRVPGVVEVLNHLEAPEEAGDIPALQGGKAARGEVPELAQDRWTPGIRILSILGGTLLSLRGMSRRDALGPLMGLGGIWLLLRGTVNQPLRRLLGLGGGAVTVQKSLVIQAPVERVFEFMADFAQNYPRFMPSFKHFHAEGDRAHWEVFGPAGMTFQGDSVLSERIQNQLIAWKSLADSPLMNAGSLRFEATPDGGTRIHLQLSYHPPFGLFGKTMAALFGSDLKSRLEEDLMRIKTFLETGKQPTLAPKIVMD